MEVKIINNQLIVKHKLTKKETYRISKGSKIQSVSVFKRPEIIGGFSNICEDLKGILMLDYDNTYEEVILEDYSLIQGIYKLPQAYLFKTKEGNYHVICLKKFFSSEIFEILNKTRADANYKDMPLRNPYKSWILRISDKKNSKRPKFIKLIGAPGINLEDEISTAHKNLLNKIHKKIEHPKYLKEDNLKLVKFQHYES
jgi:hypothetical protein